MKNILLICFLIIAVYCSAQVQKVKVWDQELELTSGRSAIVEEKDDFNGITIIFSEKFEEGLTLISSDGKRQKITLDEHVEGRIQSNLIFFDQPVKSFEINGIAHNQKINVIYQFVPTISQNANLDIRSSGCESPEIVPQSVWRAGLEDPVPGRTSTPTRHCIVHHSASSNNDTNSINLVRSFYVQHTQINGWDDIGYNYLVGHDGTIFAGRDPEKPEIGQDEVLGAHLCGKNSYTMGVCVIGNFEEVAPDPRAVDALEQLLTWKMYKDQIHPLDSLHHPDTINGSLLPVLAGHRNGCATECPGQLLFDQLPQLRINITDNINVCGPLSYDPTVQKLIKIYPNPASNFFTVDAYDEVKVRILDLSGKIVGRYKVLDKQEIDISQFASGFYFVEMAGRDGIWVEKLVVGGGGR